MSKLNLVAIRRDLHQHPETSLNEKRTSRVVAHHLQSLGLEPYSLSGTGVITDLEGAHPGPTIALRADIDALPIQEQSTVEFASRTPGVMHACGHDAHTAVLLGAAEILSHAKSELRGRIRFLFQPAEENTKGARALIKAGALDGVDAIFGLHNYPSLAAGRAAFRVGPLMAASDRIEIAVHGRSGHAAYPHLTADPLVAGAAILMGLQTAVSRHTNPLDPLVVSIGRFSGGSTFNVIPDVAQMEGTVRCFSSELRAFLPQLLTHIVNGIAGGYRCSARLEYIPNVPPVTNDATLTALAEKAAIEVLGAENVSLAEPSLGAEDFALYQQHIPGCFFWLGSGGPYGWHHPQYAIDEDALAVGAQLLAKIALRAVDEL